METSDPFHPFMKISQAAEAEIAAEEIAFRSKLKHGKVTKHAKTQIKNAEWHAQYQRKQDAYYKAIQEEKDKR